MSWKQASLAAVLAAGCGPETVSTGQLGGPYGHTEQALVVCADGGTVPGVDVSHLQGTIDWGMVADAGVTFAIMKATEGLTFTDPAFATNWQQTKAQGIYRAAYHFFRPQDDGIQQANVYLGVAGTDMTGDLPPMLDLEVTDGQTPSVILQRMSDWLVTVQAQTGKTPVIYTFPTFWSSTLGNPSGFTQYPLWIANYQVNCPDLPGQWTHWAIWQDSATATVNGISGQVDHDQFQGDLAALGAWANGSSVPDGGATDGGGTADAGAADSGAAQTDSGTTTDAGATQTDSGTGLNDAGGQGIDAGTARDAGAGDAGPDAGPISQSDAGATDAGASAGDAGNGSDHVAGGCGCSGSGTDVLALLLPLVAWMLRRRAIPRVED